ncbi:MAG: MFS transporter [Gammaproteobacteria bacterium PRO9]|nr:MFS transporter [Gammaproteobacteria bacterium PRO9]
MVRAASDQAGSGQQARLSIPIYLGYGVGQIGGQILRDTPTRWGRRRPFILAGGLLAAISFVLMFVTPQLDRQLTMFLYATVVYLVLNTGFSMFSVPYLTMASEMSDDPDERTTLISFRNCCLAVGLIVGGAAAPKIVAWVMQELGGTPKEGYRWMGIAMGAVIAASSLGVFFGTAKAPAPGMACRSRRSSASRGPTSPSWSSSRRTSCSTSAPASATPAAPSSWPTCSGSGSTCSTSSPSG